MIIFNGLKILKLFFLKYKHRTKRTESLKGKTLAEKHLCKLICSTELCVHVLHVVVTSTMCDSVINIPPGKQIIMWFT